MSESTRARRPRGVGPFIYECAGCGKQFTRPSQITGKRAFCSRECYQRACIKHPDRVCPECGTTFSPRPGSRAEGRRPGRWRMVYCSRKCRAASQRKPRGTCPRCGKELEVTAAVQKYCSRECYRPPAFLDCKTCGVRFRVSPHETVKDRQFCSMACYRTFAGESHLESRIRCALEALGVGFRQEHPAGRWSIDFALIKNRIAIEADGAYWHTITAERDAKRDIQLARAGWRIIRLAETEVNAARDVGRLILDRIREATGLELADLEPSDGTLRQPRTLRKQAVVRMPNLNARHPHRKTSKRGPVDGQMSLWD